MVKMKKWIRMNRRSYRAAAEGGSKFNYYINQHGKRFSKFLIFPENYSPESRSKLPNSVFRYRGIND